MNSETAREALALFEKMDIYLAMIEIEPNAIGLLDVVRMLPEQAEAYFAEKKARRVESDFRLLARARAVNDEIVALTGGEMDYTSDLDEVERIIRR